MERVQVVISGAGPVGSVAAYYLAKAGIDVLVLEAAPEIFQDLRASTFHASTIEMLNELGVAQDLIEAGLKAPIYQYRDRQTDDALDFDLTELEDITEFPYRVQCQQYKLVEMLAQRIAAHPNGQIRFANRVVAFEQDDQGVTVFVETPIDIQRIRADYLIAADGGSSIVRKWLDIEFEGFTYPEKFLCLTTEWPLEAEFKDLSYVNYVADPEEWVVLLKVPELWRVLVPATDDAPDAVLRSDATKNSVFQGLIGVGEEVETQHRTVYRVHQRVAKTYVQNRTILVGDAAHLNNPIGGLGMNSGIHDAWNACQKLVDIIKHGAGAEDLLARYDRQRRTITHRVVQAQTMQNKLAMESGNAELYEKRRKELAEIHADDEKRRAYLERQALFTSLREEQNIA